MTQTHAGGQADAITSERALWLGFAAATTGTLMVNVDATIVTVVMPQLQHDFALPLPTLQWAVTAYVLVITGLLPLGERLTTHVGRRRMLVIGLMAFTLGSVLAGLSPSFGALVVARMIQGIGGAVIQVNVMAIIALTFPAARRGQALGTIGSVVAAGSLAGPALGGLLTQFFTWRSIFWVNLPIGIVGMWAVRRYLPYFPPDRSVGLRRIDWTGAGLFIAATAALQFGLSDPLTGLGVVCLAGAAPAIWLFVRAEQRHPRPLIRLALFRITTFWHNVASGLTFYVLMMFPSFLLPFYLQVVLREPMWVVGLSLLPQAVMTFLVSPVGGRIADRRGVLLPGRLGFTLFAVAGLVLAVPAHVPLAVVWLVSALTGAAAGLVMAPNNSAILDSVPRADTGIASAIIATQRNLGRNIGTALAVLIPSMYWIAVGAGAAPSGGAPGYPHLFQAAFRVVFSSTPLIALAGMVLMRAPERAPSEGELAVSAG
jgi:EmrB/QacA subfamily drug resistance transporter